MEVFCPEIHSNKYLDTRLENDLLFLCLL